MRWSKDFADWLRATNHTLYGITGHISCGGGMFQLRYGKNESAVLLEHLYPHPSVPCLRRKYLKISKSVGIIGRE